MMQPPTTMQLSRLCPALGPSEGRPFTSTTDLENETRKESARNGKHLENVHTFHVCNATAPLLSHLPGAEVAPLPPGSKR